MSIQSNFPNLKPSLLLDFANTKQLDNRVTFTRSTSAVYYDGKTTAMAEQNLFTYSQQFDDASWTKVSATITANTIAAPDGTTTADTFTPTSTNPLAYQLCPSAGTFTFSVYAKALVDINVTLACTTGFQGVAAQFNLSTGTAGLVTTYSGGGTGTITGGTASIVSVGSGWYRCILAGVTVTQARAFHFGSGGTNGTSTGTIYAWGAQLEQRSTATAYTATTTQPITNYIPVLLTAGGNQPRFDCNPTTGESLGLLIEEQRTNTALQSQDFTQWTQFQNGVTTSNQMIAPDGTLTADQMVMTTDVFSGVYLATTAPSAGTYTISLWARTVSGTQTFNMGFYSASTAFFPTAFTATNTWQRFTYTVTLPSSGNFHIGNFNASAGTVFIWGAQCEAGAFATSYIATTSASATRTADAASMTGANFSSWYSQGNGTFYAEASTASVASDVMIIEGTNSGGGFLDFSMTFATTSTQFINRYVSTNNDMRKSGAVSANTMVKFSGSITGSTGTTIAATNGTTAASVGSQGANFGADRMFIGSRGGSSLFLNAPIRKLSFYPAQLTQTQQNSITG